MFDSNGLYWICRGWFRTLKHEAFTETVIDHVSGFGAVNVIQIPEYIESFKEMTVKKDEILYMWMTFEHIKQRDVGHNHLKLRLSEEWM